jgi:hypothetical protein
MIAEFNSSQLQGITYHALYQYLDRIVKLDMNAWRASYLKDRLKSNVTESELIVWMDRKYNLEQFRQTIRKLMNNATFIPDPLGHSKLLGIGTGIVCAISTDLYVKTVWVRNKRHDKIVEESLKTLEKV